MSPTPSPDGSLRSAAVINEEIRRLIAVGGQGSDAYQQLLVEWDEARAREADPGTVSPAA
ncbi:MULTISPECIES: hypothetical protein [unclassified Streptomyces]|uniref:hypothetical protein n=1 Tax=unclassified Streptomyces TaxID=2593676 RepID=UPI0033EB55D6